jgi:hypothetical protein
MLKPGTKVKHGTNTGVVTTAPHNGSVTFEYYRWGLKVTQRVNMRELKIVKEKK